MTPDNQKVLQLTDPELALNFGHCKNRVPAQINNYFVVKQAKNHSYWEQIHALCRITICINRGKSTCRGRHLDKVKPSVLGRENLTIAVELKQYLECIAK